MFGVGRYEGDVIFVWIRVPLFKIFAFFQFVDLFAEFFVFLLEIVDDVGEAIPFEL